MLLSCPFLALVSGGFVWFCQNLNLGICLLTYLSFLVMLMGFYFTNTFLSRAYEGRPPIGWVHAWFMRERPQRHPKVHVPRLPALGLSKACRHFRSAQAALHAVSLQRGARSTEAQGPLVANAYKPCKAMDTSSASHQPLVLAFWSSCFCCLKQVATRWNFKCQICSRKLWATPWAQDGQVCCAKNLTRS